MAAPASFDGVELFAQLSPAQRDAVAGKCQWRNVSAHSQILGYLDESDDVYFVIEGRVRVAVYSRGGREVSFRDLGEGEFFGEFAALDPAPRSANVIAAGMRLPPPTFSSRRRATALPSSVRS